MMTSIVKRLAGAALAAVVCSTVTAQTVSVAKYKNDCRCAISLTFDDGLKEHYTLVAPQLEKYGLRGTFAINASSIKDADDDLALTWNDVRALATRGHEISNHTWSHPDLTKLSHEEMSYQIDHCDSVIYRNTGSFTSTMILPFNAWNDKVLEECMKKHIAVRKEHFPLGQHNNGQTAESIAGWLDKQIEDGTWGVTMSHGIHTGWDQWYEPEVLWRFFSQLNERRDVVWCGTFAEVSAYVVERDALSLEIKRHAESSKGFHLTVIPSLSLNPVRYDQLLTLCIREIPKGVRPLIMQDGKRIDCQRKEDRYIFDIDPYGGEITITSDRRAFLDESLGMEERIDDAISKMTLEEKIAIIHAQSKFSSPGVPRLGIPDLVVNDGPQGVREEILWDKWDAAGHTNDSCTAYPALTSLAATWNRDLAYRYGQSIGEEFLQRGKHVAITPGININRHPYCGRNFEYMGEDPYLAGVMAAEAVKGIQSNGVAACVKHFAMNNQEKDRHKVNVVVSDRALHEIYLEGFRRAIIDGGAWTVMAAYNKYRGQFCAHNEYLNKILKTDWRFDGVLMSDWGGTEDTREAIHNGLDLEFGTYTDGLTAGRSNAYDNYYLARPYLQMIKSGEVGTEELDDKVRRVLRLMFRTSMNRQHGFGSRNSAEHSADALAIQQEGIVLLKNKGAVLPIDRERYKRILVVGENADFSHTRYGGSSGVKARYEIMPIDAIREMVGKNCVVEYQKGYTSDWPRNPQVEDSLMVEAIKAAKDAELIVFIGGHNKYQGQDTESYDRSSSNAPFRQGELLSELVKNKVPLILVTMGADLFDMPYIERIPAMLHTWYGGSESGTALAQVLFGEVNPSGKLPVTFYRKASDCGAFVMGEYPGDGENVHYDEDIFVGYRYVEKYGVKPQFSFGHGLSYTNFEYGKASLSRNIIAQDDSIEVKVPITNIGKRSGKEIVELYVRDEKSTVIRPEKELKGFDKIELAPGETKEARFIISVRDLSFYDERQGCWIAEPGKFEALIGSSSDNIKAKAVFELQ